MTGIRVLVPRRVDDALLDRLRVNLGGFVEVAGVHVERGDEAIADRIDLAISGRLDVMREGEIRAAVAAAVDYAAGARSVPVEVPVEEIPLVDVPAAILRLEAQLRALRARVGLPVPPVSPAGPASLRDLAARKDEAAPR